MALRRLFGQDEERDPSDPDIAALTRAAGIVASDGDLSVRAPQSDHDDEIGDLVAAFNSAMERVAVMYHALEDVIVGQRGFVADASHELRTPLTTVLSTLEVLKSHPVMDDAQRATVVAGALHEAQRMRRLIDDLLELAALDANQGLERNEFPWNSLLEPTVIAARQRLAPRRLVVDIADHLGNGVGDLGALERLLLVLIDNVVTHTRDDATMTISVRHDDSGKEPATVISVSDDGPGVPAKSLERIFERFARLDAARHGASAGLGLALAKAIVAGHGGTIEADNIAPHGLRVTARLPRMEPTIDRRRSPRPGAKRKRS